MTLSIVARGARTGQFGVGAMTAVPAVGTYLVNAAARVGAVEPLVELGRLYALYRERLLPEVLRMPPRENPAGSPDEGDA